MVQVDVNVAYRFFGRSDGERSRRIDEHARSTYACVAFHDKLSADVNDVVVIAGERLSRVDC